MPVADFQGLGRPHAWVEPDEARYWLTAKDFEKVIDGLLATGRSFEVTFDDGNISDFTIALPILRARGLTAGVFVCADRIDQPGYLGRAELRQLIAEGFMIGTHGAAHVIWRGLADAALDREISGAINTIADAAGCQVSAAAIPFGVYDRRVLRSLERAGIKRIYTSDGAPRLSRHNIVPRHSLRNDRTLESQIAGLMGGNGLLRRTWQDTRLLLKALR